MNISTMNNENLIYGFAETWAASTFVSNEEINTRLNEYETELLQRLNNKVCVKGLKELLVAEEVLNSEEQIDNVYKQLANDIDLNDPLPFSDKVTHAIIAMDQSGSMGEWERRMAKSVITWITKHLKISCGKTTFDYIGFLTEAQIYNEDSFYDHRKTGGAICSTGLELANNLNNKYNYENEGVITFLISDGDNLQSDNEKSLRIIKDIARKSSKFVYLELNQYNRSSTLGKVLDDGNLDCENVTRYIIRDEQDVLSVLNNLLNNL